MEFGPEIERWRERLADMRADADRLAHNQRVNHQRESILPAIQDLLERFKSGGISVEELRAEFDSRTRSVWEGFGFKGPSGAMFLNKLVKYLPSEDLTPALQAIIPVPNSEAEAKERMQSFDAFLESQISNNVATRSQLQPARLTFLISGWWHVQSRELWPVYYQSGRTVFQVENLLSSDGDLIDDYFEFRDVFRSLASALEIDPWTCEHLLDRLNQTDKTPPPPDPPIPPNDDEDDGDGNSSDEEEGTHIHIQWLLVKLGRKLGCQVWVASNDRSKMYNGERLGDLCIDALPTLGLDSHSQRTISLIDVVWIKGAKQIAAAFEVEHTTSIFSGLLRMSDLISSSPNLNFPLYIIAPASRIDKVVKQLSRPTFQFLELHKRCGYFSDEELIAKSDEIMRWATDPSALQKLANHVGDAAE